MVLAPCKHPCSSYLWWPLSWNKLQNMHVWASSSSSSSSSSSLGLCWVNCINWITTCLQLTVYQWCWWRARGGKQPSANTSWLYFRTCFKYLYFNWVSLWLLLSTSEHKHLSCLVFIFSKQACCFILMHLSWIMDCFICRHRFLK